MYFNRSSELPGGPVIRFRAAKGRNLLIPRIIHQSWKTDRIPAEYQAYARTWRELHVDWEHRLWTDDDNLDLIRRDYPRLLPTYKSYPLAIQRADMARILYLHKHGGLYVDLDFECFRPFDRLLESGGVTMGREKGGLGWYKRRLDFASNALLASPPGHPFWEIVLERMVDRARPQRWWEPRAAYVLATTGPEILDEAAGAYPDDDVTVYPADYFYPASALEKDPETRRELARIHNSHAVHHFANTWFSRPMHMIMWFGHTTRRPLQWLTGPHTRPSMVARPSGSRQANGSP